MNYPIPTSTEEIIALRNRPVDEDLIVVAIAGVIKIARSQGQSLPQITAEARHTLRGHTIRVSN
jgi:hypothetical protein